MHDSKLIQSLQLLTPTELRRLLPFLRSPYFNTNEQLVALYLLLRREYPGFDSSKLRKERVFKQLFPERAYAHQKLLNLMSELTGLVQQYLTVLQLNQEQETSEQLLLRAYAGRPDGYPVFLKQRQRIQRQLSKQTLHNAAYFQQQFQLHQQLFDHPATDKFRLTEKQYRQAMQQLDNWYEYEKLLLSCEMKAREKPLNEQYEIWLLDELRQAQKGHLPSLPIIRAYHLMLDLLEHEQEPTYHELKALLFQSAPTFSLHQRQSILQSLINYAIRQGNQGHKAFLKENLQLYQFGLEQDLLLEAGRLNDMTFIAITNVALRAQATQWCKRFLAQYGPAVPLPARDDALALGQALLLYATQQSESTIEHLRGVEFRNPYYQVQARVLLLKISLEMLLAGKDTLDWLLSQADAFERYLRRNATIARTERKRLLQFLRWLRRLAQVVSHPDFDATTKALLLVELAQAESFYNKSWLLEQLS